MNRALQLASVGLLAGAVFGLVKLGFAAVPVWILAVPFVLLGVLDAERCFAQAASFARRAGVVAFHFVIVATVFAAHGQIGGGLAGVAGTGKASAGGCGSGGCGSGPGGCGGSCGGKAKSGASTAGGASACGCGSSSSKAVSINKSATSGTNAPAAQRPAGSKTAVSPSANRPPAPAAISAERLPNPAPLGRGAANAQLGQFPPPAGMLPAQPANPGQPVQNGVQGGGAQTVQAPAAIRPPGVVIPIPIRNAPGQSPGSNPSAPAVPAQPAPAPVADRPLSPPPPPAAASQSPAPAPPTSPTPPAPAPPPVEAAEAPQSAPLPPPVPAPGSVPPRE